MRAGIGPSFIIAGLELMPIYYGIGVGVAYLGFTVLIVDLVYEPWILALRYQFQISLISAVFVIACWFTIGIVATYAPVTFYSYAMRAGNYADGTDIAGIAWDSHFTDLRVAITNPDDADYEDMDLAMRPDQWTHEAAILGSRSGCELSAIEGKNTVFSGRATKTGKTIITCTSLGQGCDVHDSSGDLFTPVASNSGYRLRCNRFPAHFTIHIVFATVTVPPDLLGAPKDIPGSAGKSFLSFLGPRPSPSKVFINGSYTKIVRPFSITQTLRVKDGD